MKNSIIFLLLSSIIFLNACMLRHGNSKKSKPNTFEDVFEFISYNDDGDYSLFVAEKNSVRQQFINTLEDRNLLRGDICRIEWKEDYMKIAGELDEKKMADWIVNCMKLEDGDVSKYRLEYPLQLKYHYPNENYSRGYLDDIYLQVEYYIANSKNELIQSAIKNKDQIEYSIEERRYEDDNYIVIGLGKSNEHNFSIMQWIFIDENDQNIYEYDLPQDSLLRFDP